MRPWHISFSDSQGGADTAAYRIHRSLLDSGVPSTLAVRESSGLDPSVVHLPGQPSGLRGYLRDHSADWALWTQKSTNGVHRSTNLIDTGNGEWLARTDATVLNLHWVGRDVLSLREIQELPKPLVWTLHDSWPFCGAEHHPRDLADHRFIDGYTRETRLSGDSRFDLDGWIWKQKVKRWSRPFHLVAPSTWMAENTQKSALLGQWPVDVIPNPLGSDAFAPGSQAQGRSRWNLPPDVPLIVFGAADPMHRNKGWDLLQEVFQRVTVPDVHVAIFGDSASVPNQDLPFPHHYIGHIDAAEELADLYRAADVVVIPSRMESFSQVAAEAQACGTPVIAFAATGLLDVVAHQQTGYLAEPYSISDFAQGINLLLADSALRKRFSHAAAERAQRLWTPAVIAPQYLQVYERAVDQWAAERKE
jgi:glycosyltransferase involved in cell wall biosynthesis